MAEGAVDTTGRRPARFGLPVLAAVVLAAGAGLAVAARAETTPPGSPVGSGPSGSMVLAFGTRHHGEPPARDIVAVEAAAGRDGYWVVTGAGHVSAHGHATMFGGITAPLAAEVVGMVSAPTGAGYWLVATDGGVFSFGDAAFHGSTGNLHLNAPITGIAATPTGRGYWLVATDGGVFSFGDAAFHGSAGDLALAEPVSDIAGSGTGRGYWLVARDAGVFSFGDARFHGSGAGALPGDATAVDITAAVGTGYLIAATGPVRLMITGDVHGERQIAAALARGENPLSEVASSLRTADVAVANLETPVSERGTPAAKQYVFRGPPTLPAAIAAAGVDVVTLANNHALDYGHVALADTIAHSRRAGLAVVGAGASVTEAFGAVHLNRRGHRVAVLGLSRVVPPGWASTASRPGVASSYEERRALDAVRSAAEQADVVVVVIHWGIEGSPCPDDSVRRLAARLRAAGATIIGGHHPHRLQGLSRDGNGLVAYSLGNFVWYHNEVPSGSTGILEIEADRRGVHRYAFHSAVIGDDGRPRLTGGDSIEAAARMTRESGCA